jgi:hypothetical protein
VTDATPACHGVTDLMQVLRMAVAQSHPVI